MSADLAGLDLDNAHRSDILALILNFLFSAEKYIYTYTGISRYKIDSIKISFSLATTYKNRKEITSSHCPYFFL